MLNYPGRMKKHRLFIEGDPHPQSFAAYVALFKHLHMLELKSYWQARETFIKNKRHPKCFYCYKDLEKNTKVKKLKITIDHFKPISEGVNPSDPRNFRICCNECNNKRSEISCASLPEKKDDIYKEYLARKKYLHKSFLEYLL